jgi:ribosomal protein S18 acetylase RimI-like enzyme
MAEIRPASWDDLDDVYALLSARSRAAFGSAEGTDDFLRTAWEVPSFEVGRDNWVAADDGRIVGYAAIEATGDFTHSARDGEVGDALLQRVEDRARERALDTIETTAVREDAPLYDLVRRSGFELEREYVRMWKRLSASDQAPRWPADIGVRTYSDADARPTQTLLDDAYAGWDPDYRLRPHEDWLHWMTRHDDFDPEMWFLVERDGDLVGAALHWKEHRGDGWVKDLVVRESERGRGLGKALLLHGFHEYRRRGAARVGLKVDLNNPTGAYELYERVGFVTDRRYGVWIKTL